MTMTVGTAGGNRDVQTITVGTAGGNKAVLEGYVGTTGGNKLFYAALSAVAAPNSATGSRAGGLPITSSSTTATPSGGTGPYTYAWSVNNADITVNSPTSATTTFRTVPLGPGDTAGTAVCVVTDTATGATATTNNVSVFLSSI